MNPSRENYLARLLLVAALLANAAGLWAELSISRADLNDNVLHFALTGRIISAIEHGENPLDSWSPEWSFGYPALRTYQPLAHLLVALAYFALGKTVALMTVFVWVRYLTVALLPLSFFIAARWMQLPPLAAAAASLLAPLISTPFLYGVEYNSFTWSGSGLFPQAVASHLLLLSLGFGYRALSEGRRLVASGALLGLTFWAHFIYGYMGAVSLCLAAALPDAAVSRMARARRIVRIGIAAMLVALYPLSALMLDHNNINHSRWEPVWKWDSFGAGQVLRWLFTGDLLDYGRLPALTLLAFAGAAIAVWRGRRERSAVHMFLASGAGFWLLMYFGRPFWGPLLALAGVSPDMHLHRVVAGAQVFLVLLAALALAAMWRALCRWHVAAAVAATLLLLYPAARERTAVLARNAAWGKRNLAAYEGARPALDAAVAKARARGGRAYAGLANGWGANFKIGDMPVYAVLARSSIPALGFLYHAMALTGDILPRFNEWNPAHYRLFNVRTLIAPAVQATALPSFLTPRETIGPLRLYEGPAAGYFDVVDVAAAVKTTRASFFEINDRWLASEWMSRRSHLLLDWGGDAPAAMERVSPDDPLPVLPSANAPPGEARNDRQSGQVYEADLDVARPAYALFRMTWHKNWKAYVDGRETATAMLSPGFVGAPVAPGHHRITMRYEPEAWRTAGAAGALLLVILMTAFERGVIAVPVRWPAIAPARWATAAGLAALALPVCAPLFTSSVLWGHDAFCYLPRLVEFHQNLAHGILLPRWAPDLGSGSGQPVFLFHPPMLYYLADFWRLFGFDFTTCLNLACAVVTAAAAAGMFLLGRLYFGAAGGWLASAAFLYAPYFAVDLYVRSALEEFTAFAFVPLALYGFGAYAKGRKRSRLLLGAAAYAGVLFSHFPAGLLFTPLILAFIAMSAWLERSWRVLAVEIGGLLLGLSLSACAWLPALTESRYVAMDRAFQGYTHYANHMVYLQQLIYSAWGYGYSYPGTNDGMSFSLGWTHLLLAVAACVWAARRPGAADRRLVRFFAAAGAVLSVLMLEDAVWIWDRVKLLQDVQMPWRLLGPAALCVAMLAGALGRMLAALSWRSAAIAAALALLIVPNLTHLQPRAYHDVDEAFWTPQQIALRGVETTTAGELTPVAVTEPPRYRTQRIEVVEGNATLGAPGGTPFSWWFDVHGTGSRIQLATAYFPGWQVRIDGRQVAAAPTAGSGLISFAAPAGDHRVTVEWTRTGVRRIADGIALLALLAFLAAARRVRVPIPAPEAGAAQPNSRLRTTGSGWSS